MNKEEKGRKTEHWLNKIVKKQSIISWRIERDESGQSCIQEIKERRNVFNKDLEITLFFEATSAIQLEIEDDSIEPFSVWTFLLDFWSSIEWIGWKKEKYGRRRESDGNIQNIERFLIKIVDRKGIE